MLSSELHFALFSYLLVWYVYAMRFSSFFWVSQREQKNENFHRERTFDVSNPRGIAESHKMLWVLIVISSCCENRMHLLLLNLVATSHLRLLFLFHLVLSETFFIKTETPVPSVTLLSISLSHLAHLRCCQYFVFWVAAAVVYVLPLVHYFWKVETSKESYC